MKKSIFSRFVLGYGILMLIVVLMVISFGLNLTIETINHAGRSQVNHIIEVIESCMTDISYRMDACGVSPSRLKAAISSISRLIDRMGLLIRWAVSQMVVPARSSKITKKKAVTRLFA